MERRTAESIRDVRVFYQYYVVPDNTTHNSALSRNQMYRDFASVGGKDVVKPLLWILNRARHRRGRARRHAHRPDGLLAGLPRLLALPALLPGRGALGKIVILEKSIQAWAAYDQGELMRWGIISTGAQSNRTPSGRFNVNWKQQERVSTLSPGFARTRRTHELWTMYWVMNLHETRGIHMHQYALPTSARPATAASACSTRTRSGSTAGPTRWTVANQRDPISSVGARITGQGTTVLIIGHDISVPPQPFARRERYPVLNMVSLPPDPMRDPGWLAAADQFDHRRGG